jgi:hypothetical protein
MRRARGERGSILIDFFVALGLFLTVLSAYLQLTSVEIRAAGAAERRFRAIALAQSRLAEIRAGAAGAGNFSSPDDPDIRGQVRVEPRPDGLRRVSVEVRWKEPRGEGQSLVLETLVSGEGP